MNATRKPKTIATVQRRLSQKRKSPAKVSPESMSRIAFVNARPGTIIIMTPEVIASGVRKVVNLHAAATRMPIINVAMTLNPIKFGVFCDSF